jgi:hypothetical protein
MACSRWPDHLFTMPIQVFTMPIWLFTIPIPVFTMLRDGCSRWTDPGVHDGPKSAVTAEAFVTNSAPHARARSAR